MGFSEDQHKRLPLYGHFKVEKNISGLSRSFLGTVISVEAIETNTRCGVKAQVMEKGCLLRKGEKKVIQNQTLPSESQEMGINKCLGLWIV